MVLILIVVEDGLVLFDNVMIDNEAKSLNPYCSGRWSRTGNKAVTKRDAYVLILIVVEDGLVLSLRQVSMGAAAVS